MVVRIKRTRNSNKKKICEILRNSGSLEFATDCPSASGYTDDWCPRFFETVTGVTLSVVRICGLILRCSIVGWRRKSIQMIDKGSDTGRSEPVIDVDYADVG